MEIEEHTIVFPLCEGDFEASMGRKPKGQDEFDEWAYLFEQDLRNGHIDWDIMYKCTRDAME